MIKKIEDILNEIISMLEKGTVPWKQGWLATGSFNPLSNTEYRGFNRWYLNLIANKRGYNMNKWATFKQISEHNGTIKKGSSGIPIMFFKKVEKREKENGEEVVNSFPVLRYYIVFNLQDTSLYEEYKDIINHDNKIDKCEEFISNVNPNIYHGGERAFYLPNEDEIHLPEYSLFKNATAYYSTLFHELGHWTGHKTRLNRLNGNMTFGNEDYAKEELIAELTNAFLCAKFGIENQQMQNSSAYIQSWLKVLKKDKRQIIYASSKAEKAYQFLLEKANAKNENEKIPA